MTQKSRMTHLLCMSCGFFKLLYFLQLTYYFFSSYSCFRFGFIGNHPFNTLSRCSNISFIAQNEEKEKTPSNEDSTMSSTITDPIIPAIPKIKNHHQQRVPK